MDFGSDQVNQLKCLRNRSEKAPFQGLEAPFCPKKRVLRKMILGKGVKSIIDF